MYLYFLSLLLSLPHITIGVSLFLVLASVTSSPYHVLTNTSAHAHKTECSKSPYKLESPLTKRDHLPSLPTFTSSSLCIHLAYTTLPTQTPFQPLFLPVSACFVRQFLSAIYTEDLIALDKLPSQGCSRLVLIYQLSQLKQCG